MSSTPERPRWMPCPRCGCARTEPENFSGGKLSCPVCKKRFDVGDARPPAGWTPHLAQMRWAFRSSDEFGNRYAIERDYFYGRRWILSVDILGSGMEFWFSGAFWFLFRAEAAAQYYRDSWQDFLRDPRFREHYGLDGSVVELARARFPKEDFSDRSSGSITYFWR